MNRGERVSAITQILCTSPNNDFSLGYFAERFGCARSSISEDMKAVRVGMEQAGFGYLETTAGSKGGVRFVPYISDHLAYQSLCRIRDQLLQSDRRIGKGFIYTTDIVFSPESVRCVAQIFARRFAGSGADVVVTLETKGIGIALCTAELLHLPLAVIRREAKVSEGPTVSINYFSGSGDRIQKMNLSKKALSPGAKVLLIDDFMRGGGSIQGMKNMLAEFSASAVGVGVFLSAGEKKPEVDSDVFSLIHIDDSSETLQAEVLLPEPEGEFSPRQQAI